ncbi:MAG TPA: LuxR C-terminal-related transcriptional regulator [Candidatus Kapabacteria bacterium]|jgi:DNA-binding CsgD family transcriptional regulator|nr:LuxR C-terminal-related transcriptional regulator [Candidatus Kapabacteria bacterium]
MVPQKVIELVRSTADASYAVDPEGMIVAWNAAAAAAFGRDEADAVGRICGEVIGGFDECGPVCSVDCTVLRSAHQRRPLRNFDLQVPTPLGRRWFNISVLIYSEFGSPDIYTIHLARPIDTRKRLEILVRDFVRTDTTVDEPTGRSVNRASIANAALSDREIDVLRLLAQGLTTSEIARQLGISRTTVNNHVQHAMSKLNAHSRLEAIRKAEFGGLI